MVRTNFNQRKMKMIEPKKPGTSTGPEGGIYQEIGPKGRVTKNFIAVGDNKSLPPTTKPGNAWKPVKLTPDSKRKG